MPNPNYPVVGIQVAATINFLLNTSSDETQFEVTSADDMEKTHWSVYTRHSDGTAEHVVDYAVMSQQPSALESALAKAAELSHLYNVPIEKIS
jgi:hypothetical protein